jgi:flagellar hook-associated protein 3 FlgL
MIGNLSPSAELFVASLGHVEQRLSNATAQMSSGRKINVPADAPDQIGTLLQLRADQQRNYQIQSNLALATTDAQAADGALARAATLMDTAIQLASQGANSTQTADSRRSIATQVEGLLQEMVSVSQTQVRGRYIFSGDQEQNPTYQTDLTAPTGVDELARPSATAQIEDPAGGSFAASKTAQDIFGNTNADGSPAPDNVFAALSALRTALLNNDQAGITNAISSVRQASTRINNMAAFYGTVEKRIQNATDFAASYDTQLATQISSTQDADPAAAAVELTQANTQLQASLQMQGMMPRSSLFDYLG